MMENGESEFMSNTSKGRGKKGSKFWMQTLVSLHNGIELTKEIQMRDNTIGDIKWISPLEKEDYIEYKLNSSKIVDLPGIDKKDMDFWPSGQPQWDAIGFCENSSNKKTIILVEAKAHVDEMNSSCTAESDKSKELIEKTLKETYENLNQNKDKEFNKKIWMETYYQLGNRLAFLYELKKKGYDVRLVLLNIINDPTFILTSEEEWKKHYKEVFIKLIGTDKVPEDVVILNLEILMKWRR